MGNVGIKLRHGLPTKKDMHIILEEYDRRFWLVHTCQFWTQKTESVKYLWWHGLSIQSHMDGFIEYAKQIGFVFGEYTPYTGTDGKNGMLQVIGLNRK